MSNVRTILVALIALSVAMLPVAGGFALTASHDATFSASHSDCCHQGKPCEKEMDGCGSTAACAVKCFGFSGVSVESFAIALRAPVSQRPDAVPSDLRSTSENPPLPPPRA
jgi:hypothetical protein